MSNSDDDCGKCHTVVTNRQHALFCDKCQSWFHRKCMNGTISSMSQQLYLTYVREETDFDWTCDCCKNIQNIHEVPTVIFKKEPDKDLEQFPENKQHSAISSNLDGTETMPELEIFSNSSKMLHNIQEVPTVIFKKEPDEDLEQFPANKQLSDISSNLDDAETMPELEIFNNPLKMLQDVKNILYDADNTENVESKSVSGLLDTKYVEKEFKCDTCAKVFLDPCKFQTHSCHDNSCSELTVSTHNQVYKFPCEVCGRRMKNKARLKRHMLTHTGVRPYKCDMCEKRFRQKHALIVHKRTHTGERPFVCKICKRGFSQKANLNDHRCSHHIIITRRFKCRICTKSFTNKYSLMTHLKSVHSGRPFGCNICPNRYVQRESLQRHMASHTGNFPFSCQICCKKFTNQTSYNNHVLSSRCMENKDITFKFQCQICKRGFLTNSHLQRHMRIHTGELPHSCNLCDKSFAWKTQLTTHMAVHDNKSVFTCEVCKREFNRKSSLTRHMLTHTGQRPYTCEICSKSYTRATRLRDHMLTHETELVSISHNMT